MLLFQATTALLAANLPITVHALVPRGAICTEGSQLICYDDDDDEATSPTTCGGSATPPTTMRGRDSGRCRPRPPAAREWTLPVPDAGPVLPLAKHVKPWLDSSVLFAGPGGGD
ncbi:hypothetical protein ISF_04830 [Cordyceps fumosorosea ARSEF 2679]|uniref:Secreted protein n=1 Tax=Cordyceps fumosorosea (strain ARSEF 2679) TaxID=1081104 RepID=A0A167VT40_CORFA|nr:hypothetical protein ISF_04830 [Cordyceps fumosorosea ARSEF 2679]OAA62954.1 hypothetical protein ISF_04830 [Cordyceps fumosorosea ARSEF 2679]